MRLGIKVQIKPLVQNTPAGYSSQQISICDLAGCLTNVILEVNKEYTDQQICKLARFDYRGSLRLASLEHYLGLREPDWASFLDSILLVGCDRIRTVRVDEAGRVVVRNKDFVEYHAREDFTFVQSKSLGRDHTSVIYSAAHRRSDDQKEIKSLSEQYLKVVNRIGESSIDLFFAELIVKVNPYWLSFMPQHIQDNPVIVKIAIQQDKSVLEFASERLKFELAHNV